MNDEKERLVVQYNWKMLRGGNCRFRGFAPSFLHMYSILELKNSMTE